MAMKTLVQTLLQPISPERRRVNAGRFLDLPDSLKTPEQIIGFAHHSCGATHGVLERCDFACTSCYLGEEANAAEPLSREEVFQQLDQLREFLGPQGKAQITAGEVTLLPREVAGRVCALCDRHRTRSDGHDARSPLPPGAGISAEADRRRRSGEDLDPRRRHATGAGGVESIRHRRTTPPGQGSVCELDSRDAGQDGAKTPRRPHCHGHPKNLDQIPAVMRWLVRNLDAFRMVSFQPVAEVGRTQDQAISDLNLTDCVGTYWRGPWQAPQPGRHALRAS